MSSQADDPELQAAAIARMAADPTMAELSRAWFLRSAHHKYSYNFSWLGRPVIQYPQDLMAMQELVFRIRPDLIIETGVAHGGSLAFYASLQKLLGDGRVLGIEVDLRPANRAAIAALPVADRIDLIDGSSTDPAVAARVLAAARGKRVLLALDANHTHDHVLQELQLYTPLVPEGSYAVVFDTVIAQMPADAFPDRPWGPGNNPHTAVQAFLATSERFEVDLTIDAKLQLGVAPGGYLRARCGPATRRGSP